MARWRTSPTPCATRWQLGRPLVSSTCTFQAISLHFWRSMHAMPYGGAARTSNKLTLIENSSLQPAAAKEKLASHDH